MAAQRQVFGRNQQDGSRWSAKRVCPILPSQRSSSGHGTCPYFAEFTCPQFLPTPDEGIGNTNGAREGHFRTSSGHHQPTDRTRRRLLEHQSGHWPAGAIDGRESATVPFSQPLIPAIKSSIAVLSPRLDETKCPSPIAAVGFSHNLPMPCATFKPSVLFREGGLNSIDRGAIIVSYL